MQDQFWKNKSIRQFSDQEWEALCDGCGICCLHKMEDGETCYVFYTKVACKLFDTQKCCCTDYKRRFLKVLDCLYIKEEEDDVYYKLPPSCAYRRIYEGKDLPSWHHLICNDREMVHKLGKSARGKCVSELDVDGDDYEEFIISLED